MLEQRGDGPLDKYRRVLVEKFNITSTNRGLRTNNHTVATYEQRKERVLQLLSKRNCREWLNPHSSSQFVKEITSFSNVWCLFMFIHSN